MVKKNLSLVENYKYLDTISEAVTSYKKSASSLGAFLQNLKDDIRRWDDRVIMQLGLVLEWTYNMSIPSVRIM